VSRFALFGEEQVVDFIAQYLGGSPDECKRRRFGINLPNILLESLAHSNVQKSSGPLFHHPSCPQPLYAFGFPGQMMRFPTICLSLFVYFLPSFADLSAQFSHLL
jgi:hypothetical protein